MDYLTFQENITSFDLFTITYGTNILQLYRVTYHLIKSSKIQMFSFQREDNLKDYGFIAFRWLNSFVSDLAFLFQDSCLSLTICMYISCILLWTGFVILLVLINELIKILAYSQNLRIKFLIFWEYFWYKNRVNAES